MNGHDWRELGEAVIGWFLLVMGIGLLGALVGILSDLLTAS